MHSWDLQQTHNKQRAFSRWVYALQTQIYRRMYVQWIYSIDRVYSTDFIVLHLQVIQIPHKYTGKQTHTQLYNLLNSQTTIPFWINTFAAKFGAFRKYKYLQLLKWRKKRKQALLVFPLKFNTIFIDYYWMEYLLKMILIFMIIKFQFQFNLRTKYLIFFLKLFQTCWKQCILFIMLGFSKQKDGKMTFGSVFLLKKLKIEQQN